MESLTPTSEKHGSIVQSPSTFNQFEKIVSSPTEDSIMGEYLSSNDGFEGKEIDVNSNGNNEEETLITKNPFYFFKRDDSILLIPALIFNILCASTDIASTIMINKAFTSLTDFHLGKYSSKHEFLDNIKLPVFGIILIGFSTTIFGWLETTLFTYLGEKQQIRCRQQLFKSLLSRDLTWFEKNSNLDGDLVQVNRSVEEFRASISEYLSILFKSIFSIISLIIISMIYSWKLTLLVFAIIPIIIFTIIIFGNKIDKWAKLEDDYTSKGISLLDWNFSSFLWVKIIYSRDSEIEKFGRILDGVENSFRNFSIFANIVAAIMKTISLMLFVQSFWFGSYLVKHKKDSGSDIISAFYSCLKLAMTIGNLSVIAVVFQKANTSFKKIVEFLLSNEDIKEFNRPLIIPDTNLRGDIELIDVNFKYNETNEDEEENTTILNNISLKIDPFKITYIIGKSGSGKSTIANMLLKLYEPSSGTITIDGYSLDKLDGFWLREQITLVQQFPKIFNDTLENNILLGTSYNSIDSKDVIEAIKYFNLLEVIEELPDGYQTYVGKADNKKNKLVQLSGGQEQKLNLLKAKLKDSNVLILDESISALDIQQRELFMEKFYEWRKNKTTIIITHELTHIKDDDMVHFIENGKIVESGLKYQLVNLSGKFAKLENQGNNEKFEHKLKRKSLFFDLEDKGDIESQIIINEENDETEDDQKSISNIRTPILITYKLLIKTLSTRYRLYYILGIFTVICSAILTPVFSYCFSKLISGIIPQHGGTLISTYEQLKWSLIATAIAIVIGLTTFISMTILEFTAERLCKDLQNLALHKILKQKVEFFEYLSINEITTLLMNDIRDFRTIFSSNLSRLISGIAISFVCIIWTLVIGWKYALVGFSFFPLFGICSFISATITQRAEFQYKDSLNEAESIIYETRVGIKTIMCLNVQNHFEAKFTKSLNKVLKNGLKRAISMGFSINIIYLLVNIAQSIMLYYGFQLVANSEYTLVRMMQIIMMILMSVSFLSELMTSAPGLYRGLRVSLKLNKLIFSLNNDYGEDSKGYLTPNFKNVQTDNIISFNNVKFSYSTNPNSMVLNNLNMEIPKNKIVSIVGESGCGKSTIMSLMLRLYSTNNTELGNLLSNQIEIDRYDINTIKLSHLMANMSVVTQKHYFINGTIRENLLYGNKDRYLIDDSLILQILEKLSLLSIIRNNSKGLDSILSNNGNLTVSGGQAQRLSIARALLRNSSILLLDEFSSSLDSETTKLVLNILKGESLRRSVICITHQESIMKNSDLIYFIKNGSVSECGTYDKLLKDHGDLYKMVYNLI